MPESKAQVRAAYAVKSGKAKGLMPRSVANEIIAKIKGGYRHLPERAKGGKRA